MQSSTYPEFEECLPPPAGLEVSSEWADDFLARFADVRQSLRRWAATPAELRPPARKLPALSDVQAWSRLCGWSVPAGGGAPARASVPDLGLLLQLDALSVQTLVQLSGDWLEAAWEEDGRDALRYPRSLWLFALLARLDSDLLADTAARLRLVFRVLTRVRARHSCEEAGSAKLAELSMLVIVVARYFRQAAPGEC
mmetsp:Transcript_23988/g.55496  ORF Transcript_23988/g.55496 Transcript_23988/m.55496 type:complete len:197 (-) Transcript_23988:42-632(-)